MAETLYCKQVAVPALLVAGTLDTNAPPAISQEAFRTLPTSTENRIVLIENAKHRHFDSGLCAQTQNAGGIASMNPGAILDLQTLSGLVIPSSGGVAMDFCGFETFTKPTDIRSLVALLTRFNGTEFNVTRHNVPTTGLDTSEVKEEVTELAVAFFGHVFSETPQEFLKGLSRSACQEHEVLVDKIRIFGLVTLAVWNFDGEGNVSGFATSSAGGVILRRAPVTATYTLDSDRTGILTFEAAQAHWDIVVTRDGREGAYIRVVTARSQPATSRNGADRAAVTGRSQLSSVAES